MPQTQEPRLTLVQATRLTYEIFGAEETERALAEVFLMPEEEIRQVMQQLKATEN